MLHKALFFFFFFWVKHTLGNCDYLCLGRVLVPRKLYVITLIYVIICENVIIFGNAYGEMHDLLAWKRLASLIKFLRMNFISYCIICKIKDALIFGKIDTKSS